MRSRRDVLCAGFGAALGSWCGGPAAAGAQAIPGATLRARPVTARLPGTATDRTILTFGDGPQAPVLRARKGQGLAVTVRSELDLPFALQWHGARLPNDADGDWPLAGELVEPGQSRVLPLVFPDSGLFWAHPAALPHGGDLTARGLRAILVVEEETPPATDADLVLCLAEWDAETAGAPASLTVNGAQPPQRSTLPPGARLRLRLVNATTTRPFVVGVEGARPFVIAVDGQPCDRFEPAADSVPIGPGARFELMLDLPREPGATVRLALRGGPEATALFEATTAGDPRPTLPPIAALPANPMLPRAIPLERAARADLVLEDGAPQWRLNGVAGPALPATPLLKVGRGQPVTLGFVNRSAAVVPLRLHGHAVRLLHAKDDGWEPYWRDSVILLPGTVAHVAFVADNPGRWLIESALFAQAAAGLRHWFEVG